MVDEFCKKIETVIREHKLPADPDKNIPDTDVSLILFPILSAGLIAYNLAPKKLPLNIDIIDLDKIKAIV